MKYLLRRELESLTQVTGPCVSIYLPLNSGSRENGGDPLRLKKLAEDAERQLISRGFTPGQIEPLLMTVHSLPDSEAWTSRGRSMVVLVGPDTSMFLSFDVPLGPEAWGDDHFHVRPLLPLTVESDRFFLLALSERKVQLYEGDGQGLKPVRVAGMPKNIDDALQIDGADRGSQTHSANAGGHGRAGAIFHGHGGKADTAKTNLRDYFQQVATALDRHLQQHRELLVVATVGENMPIWREVSRYSHLSAEFVPGSPDRTPLGKIHDKALRLVEAQFDREAQDAYARLCAAKGTPRAVIGLGQVLPAASEGKIDTLFVDCNKPICGRFDPASGGVEVQDCASGRNVGDLLDVAIQETLNHRGKVFPLDSDGDLVPAEALLRY